MRGIRDLADRHVPRDTRLGRGAWAAGRRLLGPKVLVPGTLGDVFLLTPTTRASVSGLRAAGLPASLRIDHAWPVKPVHVHRCHGYRLSVIDLGNDPKLHTNAYRAAFVGSSLVLLEEADLSRLVWRMRGLGDPLGYAAAREARAVEPRLPADLPEEVRFGLATVAHVARRARGLVVPDAEERARLELLGSRTPVSVVVGGPTAGGGPSAAGALAQAVIEALELVSDPARGALAMWAQALADMGVRGLEVPGAQILAYGEALSDFKGSSHGSPQPAQAPLLDSTEPR